MVEESVSSRISHDLGWEGCVLHLHEIVKNKYPLDSCPGNSESCSDDNDNAQKKFQWLNNPPFFAFDIFGVLLFVYAWHSAKAALHELDN